MGTTLLFLISFIISLLKKDEAAKNPELRMSHLKSFLIKPVQRICKYPLLIKAMIENSPFESEREYLQKACTAMEETVETIDKQLFIEDSKMKVLELESSLNWHRDPPIKLAVNNRGLIYDSVFLLAVQRESEKAAEPKRVNAYLLTDMLIITKKKKSEYLLFVLPIEYCVVLDVPNKLVFQLLYAEESTKFQFYSDSIEEKEKWVRKLNKRINSARKDLASSLNKN